MAVMHAMDNDRFVVYTNALSVFQTDILFKTTD